jgi:hypothetical protein
MFMEYVDSMLRNVSFLESKGINTRWQFMNKEALITRARNELYLSYPKIASRAGPGGMMLTPSRFILELPTDLYEALRIKRNYGW